MALLNEVENYLLHLWGGWCRKRAQERTLRLVKRRGCNASLFQLLILLGGHDTNTTEEGGFKRGGREQRRFSWLIYMFKYKAFPLVKPG